MNILKSISSFGSFTLLSRVLGYFRDILIAIFVGTSAMADAFFVAFRLPNTFRRLFAEGTFNAAFVPIYTKLNLKNNSENFTNNVFNFLLIYFETKSNVSISAICSVIDLFFTASIKPDDPC